MLQGREGVTVLKGYVDGDEGTVSLVEEPVVAFKYVQCKTSYAMAGTTKEVSALCGRLFESVVSVRV